MASRAVGGYPAFERYRPFGQFEQDQPLDAEVASAALAVVLDELAGADRRPAAASDDAVIGMLAGFDKLTCWAEAGRLGLIRELIRRRALPGHEGRGPAGLPAAWDKGVAQEVSAQLAISARAADTLIGTAYALARLPGVAAALEAGIISGHKAAIIAEATGPLDDQQAAEADRRAAPRLGGKTPGQVRELIRRIVLSVDPEGARRRREEAQHEHARVELWQDQVNGTANLAGFGLPPDEALIANQRIQDRALAYKKAGVVPGAAMDLLRVRAYIDLLLGRDPRNTPPTTPSDTGATDTGTAAAGAPDSGAANSGAPDAGAANSGTSDGRTADAGASDRGAPDAGASDRGAPDAGASDRGAPDADPADARTAGGGAADGGAADGRTAGGGAPDGGAAGGGTPDGRTAGGGAADGKPAAEPASATDYPGTDSGSGNTRDGSGTSGSAGQNGDAKNSHKTSSNGPQGDSNGSPQRDGNGSPEGDCAGKGPEGAGNGSPQTAGNGTQPGGSGPAAAGPPAGTPAAGSGTGPGPGLAANVNLTIPLATLLGLAERPGQLAGLGPIDPALARDMATAAARSDRSAWCVTITNPDGHAIGHGCGRPARSRKQKPGPSGTGPPGTVAAARTRDGPAFTPAGGGPAGGLRHLDPDHRHRAGPDRQTRPDPGHRLRPPV